MSQSDPSLARADSQPATPVPQDRHASLLAWVPIRSLAERHRPRIGAHLHALPAADRHLRFGYQASDEQIERYVEAIDFDRDEVFGIFNRRLELIAVAHLAFQSAESQEPSAAEFGVSVLPAARGRGFGSRLFDHAVLRARNRSTETLLIHALSENGAMLAIARKAGAIIMRDGAEAQARLKLPPDTFVSHFDEALASAAGEMDFRMKSQAKMLDGWLKSISSVRAHIDHDQYNGLE